MKRTQATGSKKAKDRERLRALIEEATVDCYGEDEQHVGLLTMIQEQVTVTGLESAEAYGIAALCDRNGKQYRVDVGSLEWIKPYAEGFEWIEAYLEWRSMLC